MLSSELGWYRVTREEESGTWWVLIGRLCPVPSSLYPLSRLQASCHQLKLWPELQDNGGDYVSAALGPLTNILVQGLGCRLHLLAHSRPPVPEVRRL